MFPTKKTVDASDVGSQATKRAEEKTIECSFCHKKGFRRETLKKHYSKCSSFNQTSTAKLECLDCHLKFEGNLKLQAHLKVCTDRQPNTTFFCNKCNKAFRQQHELNRHVFKCQNEYIFCVLCPYKSALMNSVRTHILDKHHLKCTPVNKPDFEQAMNWAPYILERLEGYPYKDVNRYSIKIHNPMERVNGLAVKKQKKVEKQ